MNIAIKDILNAGELPKERVVLKVSSATDVGQYQIADTQVVPDGFNNRMQRVFWFPDKAVEAGDLIILYTRAGNESEKQNRSGATSHFFYWGLSEAIWLPGRGVVLMRIDDWEAERVPDCKPE